MTSINTSSHLVTSSLELNKTFSQASSGKRVNSAADDAAGLAIATRFSSQVSGAQQAQRNGLDAKSLIETEDGALEQISNSIQRLQELAIQQGNGVLNNADRAALSKEANQISDQINQVIEQSSFNGKDLFQKDSDTKDLNFQLGDKAGDLVSMATNTTATPIQQGLDQLDFSSSNPANNLNTLESIQQKVTERRSELGAVSHRIDSSIEQRSNEAIQTESARSRVEDIDVAALVSQMVVERVKQQAQLAIQSQANASAEDTLRLLS
ncbi:MAG: flagellin [Oleispira sp.]|jgi:flagellin